MIRFLLTILISCTLVLATAQTPVVKPLQYKVLIERIIQRRTDAKCFMYTQYPNGATTYGCITSPPVYQGGTNYSGYCLV